MKNMGVIAWLFVFTCLLAVVCYRETQDRELITALVQNQKAEADILSAEASKR